MLVYFPFLTSPPKACMVLLVSSVIVMHDGTLLLLFHSLSHCQACEPPSRVVLASAPLP